MREIHSKQVKCLVQKSIHQYFWIRITWALLSVLSGKFVHRKKRTLKFGRWDLNLPTSMNPFALKLRRKVGGFITQRTLYSLSPEGRKRSSTPSLFQVSGSPNFYMKVATGVQKNYRSQKQRIPCRQKFKSQIDKQFPFFPKQSKDKCIER